MRMIGCQIHISVAFHGTRVRIDLEGLEALEITCASRSPQALTDVAAV